LKKTSGAALDPVALLLRWFAGHRRDLPWRKNRSLYRVWVAEVMLQQTRVETVVPYYRDFLKRFPLLPQLAAAPLRDVLKAWEGLGYYARARNLWRAARMVRENFHGLIPGEYAEFRKLPGVGDYIAAAVLSIGCGQPLPVVDGNVLRVVSRWQGMAGDIRLTAVKKKIHAFLCGLIPANSPGPFNEAMMELGALVCTPKNPLCPKCPLRQGCFAFGHGKTACLPVKGRKKPVPTHQVALAVIVRAGKVFIQQRRETGHLGGLWEFPGGKCQTAEDPERAVVRECREELGIEVEVLTEFAEVRHAYSHFRIILHVFACRLAKGRPKTLRPHAWVKSAELKDFPFPAANHKFFPQLKEYLTFF
jgi:A/G-specific adenine glycosylase